MPSIIEALPEPLIRQCGWIASDTGSYPIRIRQFDGENTIYRYGNEAIVAAPQALNRELIIFGFTCQIGLGFVPVPVWLYEVVAMGEVDWGAVAGVTESPLMVLNHIRYASVPSALFDYAYVIRDRRA